MDFTDVSLTALRVLRAVAEQGTFTAAAGTLGYTQSAVSRQIAALERAAGAELLERRRDGVRPTAAGRIVLRRATVVLGEIDATARELSGLPGQAGTVRLGWFPSAGAVLVPRALTALRRTDPDLHVSGREGGSTPALVRALRADSLDLAVLASAPPFRPPDAESPPLVLRTLSERPLRLAVPATHPLARGDFADVADLRGQRWIAGSSSGEDRLLGVWPGLDERPEIVLTARDWLAKLHLVAAGCGLTTVPAALAPAVPPGVRVLPVRGGPQEQRRLLLARLPHPPAEAVARVSAALHTAALDLDTPGPA
ncbi:LysR family transcriptional regulator [Streptomyces collinus]|uniref:LysR family transcriptional regulator n=1 Tax=Streptomyces collinus (strain DSM 40733 / Tue 365) TaxID=1214242 RepID=S5VGE0_STRC3|nr:LysR family transcriptional regulator [Streptomyces collinus]AGS67495.1 LysR family transcriptional regulator [Streptomyces collinus Tu 365]UJA06175.1 LysR family transcriptional regulator [Streptomyces collinus]UJA12655.1 LysR family transcriptional regulator [Streptomyces collinus]